MKREKQNPGSNQQRRKLFLSAVVYDGGSSGIAEYTRQLSHGLSRDNTLCLALLKEDIPRFPIVDAGVKIIEVSNYVRMPIISIIWHLLCLPILAHYHHCDFIVLPAANRRMLLWASKPVIGIVHDLSQYNIKDKYDISRTIYVKYILPIMTSSMDIIIAISNNTRNDIVRYWGLKKDNIQLCYNGYDINKYNTKGKTDDHKVPQKYGIDKEFLLYVARIEHPGKNHVGLIKAFEKLPAAISKNLYLVFAGGEWNGAEFVKKAIEESPLKNNIKLLGFVADEHLPVLTKLAKACVIPSFYEGFGIPLVEAMACSTPCLCSNTSALDEVAGDAALTFDPSDSDDICSKILDVLTDQNLREQLQDRGIVRCREFSWTKLQTALNQLMDKFQRNIAQQKTNSEWA